MTPREHRRWLAEQAARCMSERAIDDPLQALQRVMRHHGRGPDRRLWPDADEIRAALRDYQRLFHGNRQPRQLELRREAARAAMRFLAQFRPLLVGAVLDGSAGPHSPVQLHLHCDETEAVLRFLQEQCITHRVGERRLRLQPGTARTVPCVQLEADGIDFELWILPANLERQAPLQADGHGSMLRAALTAVPRD